MMLKSKFSCNTRGVVSRSRLIMSLSSTPGLSLKRRTQFCKISTLVCAGAQPSKGRGRLRRVGDVRNHRPPHCANIKHPRHCSRRYRGWRDGEHKTRDKYAVSVEGERGGKRGEQET